MIKDYQESSLIFKKKKHTLKVILGVSLVVFIMVFMSVINILLKNKKEQENIDNLNAKANEMVEQNKKLKSLIDSYNTTTNKEREARENLNVMRDGENVVAINDNKKEVQISNTSTKRNANKGNYTVPNYIKWMDFFFLKNNDKK